MFDVDIARLTVLLLEDDPDDQLIFREYVEDFGERAPRLLVADDVGAAASLLKAGEVDICFVDYRLGADSGLDFIREHSGVRTDVPFVLLTGQGGAEVDEAALRAGAKLYLQKGAFSSEELSRCLRYTVAHVRDLALLQDQRRVVNELLESLGEVLWIYDVETKSFLEVGPGIERISGRTAEEIKSDPDSWSRLVNDGYGPVREKLLRASEPGGARKFDYSIRDREGVDHLIREHTYRMRTPGGQDWLVGVLRDVTEEQASQSELLLMREVIQQVEDSILVTDNQLDAPDGPHILFANPAFLKMTGYTLDEVIGESPRILQGPKTSRLVLESLKGELRAGRRFTAEAVNYRKDGSEYMVRWSITPVVDGEGGVKYYASVQRDVTEEVQERQRRMRAQRLESLGNMVGGIAHDLNNILSPILMGAGLLEDADEPAMRSSISKTMVESAERAADLVGKLLTFARGGGSEKTFVAPARLLGEIHKIVVETFPREIEVRMRLGEPLWTVRCSPAEIHQVLMNLAINAKDSMQGMPKGLLTLSAENVRLGPMRAENLGIPGGGDFVSIGVVDTGAGIPPEVMDRIFDPFFTTKEPGKGTGLGLPSALGIVRDHAGALDVASEPGNGTRFTVFLPAFPDRAPDSKAADGRRFERGQGQQVLVVDDEPSITHLVCEMLEEYGYRAKGLTSSSEALKYFREHGDEFDALLTDMMMPELDGLALIRKIHGIRSGLPVLVMTGYVHHDKLEEMKRDGVKRVLTKPVRLEALMAEVNALFRESP